MKKIDVLNSVGLKLCHDITEMKDGFKGARFKRGHIIEKDDIEVLLNLGKKHIFILEENDNMIHEEDAAKRLSKLCDVQNTHFTDVSEGKIQLIADIDGFFTINIDLLKKINSIGEITICSIPNHYNVKSGMRLASMRVIPLFIDEKQILDAEKICEKQKIFNLYPYHKLNVGAIITGSEVYHGRIKDKFEPVIREKIKKFDGNIIDIKICDDDIDMIIDSAKELLDKNIDLLIFTGGMSVDPDDLTPTAIKNLGGNIISYGMPSQPGNMTLISYLDDIAIIGIPGAAISRPITTFDVFLPQIFAKIKITKNDLINLSDGGLCQLCENCHFPNCTFGKY